MGEWSARQSMPAGGTYGGTSVTLGRRLFCFGGTNDTFYETFTLVTNFEYSPDSDTWTPRNPMTLGRGYAAGAAVSGKAYICGGTFGSQTLVEYTPLPAADQLILNNLHQRKSDGTDLAPEGEVFVGSAIFFEGNGTIPWSATEKISLDVEVCSSDDPFTGIPTLRGAYVAPGVTGFFHDLRVEGSWKWQARLVTESGDIGAWMPFGTADPDFIVVQQPIVDPPPLPEDPDAAPAKSFCGGSARAGLGSNWCVLMFVTLACGRRPAASSRDPRALPARTAR